MVLDFWIDILHFIKIQNHVFLHTVVTGEIASKQLERCVQ